MQALTAVAVIAVTLSCAAVAQASFNFTQRSYSAGAVGGGWAESVAVGTFNGDSHTDVAVAKTSSSPGQVSILLGDGQGALGAATSVPSGADGPYDLAVGDFDGDSKVDLVVVHTNFGGPATVLLGNGDGSFKTAVPYTTGAVPYAVTVGDFNEDGSPDFATAESGGGVSVFLNKHDGTGTFNSRAGYSTAHSPFVIATADTNGDGHLDLLAGEPGSTSNVAVLQGDGHGVFTNVGEFPLASGGGNLQGAMGVGDLNGDERPDLAAPGWDVGTLSVLLNSGSGGAGTFGGPTSNNTGYGTIAAQMGDFDLDGKRDVAIANKPGSGVGVVAGNGAGGLGPVQSAGPSSNASDLKIADFNEDGRPDLVSAAGGSNTADVFLNTSPVPAAAPRAATGGSSGVDDHQATLLGIVDPHGLHTTYHFEYGTTTAYGATGSPTSDQDAGSDDGDTVVSTDIGGLAPSTTYHYRLVAQNLGGTRDGADRTFTTAAAPAGGGGGGPVAPAAETGGTSSLTGTSATLLGNVNPHGQAATYRFGWGTDPANETLTPIHDAGSGNGDFVAAADLSGLAPGTTYHYHVTATNTTGTTDGADRTFVTPGPTAVTQPAGGLELSSATLHGIVNPHGQQTTYHFEFGLTSAYGEAGSPTPGGDAGSGVTDQAVNSALTDLHPDTAYHFRLVATNSSGTSYGADQTFTTVAAPPDANTQDPTGVTKTAANLLGTVDPGAHSANTTYSFEYADEATYNASGYNHVQADTPVPAKCVPGHSPCIRRAGPVSVGEPLTGLDPGTVYHYRLVAKGPGGTTSTTDGAFRTVADPPEIVVQAPSSVGATGATINATIDDKGNPVTYDVHYVAVFSGCNGTTQTVDDRTGAVPLTGLHGQQAVHVPIDAGALNAHVAYQVETQDALGALVAVSGQPFDTLNEGSPGGGIATGVTAHSVDLAATLAPRQDDLAEGYFFQVGKTSGYGTPGAVGLTIFDKQVVPAQSFSTGGAQSNQGLGGSSFGAGINSSPDFSVPSYWGLADKCPRVAKAHTGNLDPGTTYHFRAAVGELSASCASGSQPYVSGNSLLGAATGPAPAGEPAYGTVVCDGDYFSPPNDHVTLQVPDAGAFTAGPDQTFTTPSASSGGTIDVTPGGATLKVSCAGSNACNGKAALLAGGTTAKAAASKKPTQLGFARFRIPAGKARRIKITLTRAGRRRVRQGRTVRATLVLTVRSGSGPYVTTTRSVAIKRRHGK